MHICFIIFMLLVLIFFFFERYGDHRDLHVLTHSCPTRRSSDLDVARAAGVSPKTVSRVLNDEANVRGPTREKVLVAMAAMDYRPHQSARSLDRKSTRLNSSH